MENKFIVKNGHGKSTLLDKQYGKLIQNSLNKADEKKIERWECYNLIVEELLKINNDNLFTEIKYRLTDGEDPNQVLVEILDRVDAETVSYLLWHLKGKLKEYIQDDLLAKYY